MVVETRTGHGRLDPARQSVDIRVRGGGGVYHGRQRQVFADIGGAEPWRQQIRNVSVGEGLDPLDAGCRAQDFRDPVLFLFATVGIGFSDLDREIAGEVRSHDANGARQRNADGEAERGKQNHECDDPRQRPRRDPFARQEAEPLGVRLQPLRDHAAASALTGRRAGGCRSVPVGSTIAPRSRRSTIAAGTFGKRCRACVATTTVVPSRFSS